MAISQHILSPSTSSRGLAPLRTSALGESIVERRQRMGMSRLQLAALTFLAETRLRAIEEGRRVLSVPEAVRVERILAALENAFEMNRVEIEEAGRLAKAPRAS